jgi:co-chaperonin GroES (HSP10)
MGAAEKRKLIAEATDARLALQMAVGDLSKVEVLSGRVLVAIYIAPERSKGGVYRPQTNVAEDVWQGTVGLVLKKGKLAFKDDEINKFHGQDVQVGDWVVFRPGDARRIQIRDVDCRIVQDTLIDAVIDDPETVTHSK